MDNQLARDRWLHTLSHSEQEHIHALLKTLGVSTGQDVDAVALAIAKLAKYGQALADEAQAGASGAAAAQHLLPSPELLPSPDNYPGLDNLPRPNEG